MSPGIKITRMYLSPMWTALTAGADALNGHFVPNAPYYKYILWYRFFANISEVLYVVLKLFFRYSFL